QLPVRKAVDADAGQGLGSVQQDESAGRARIRDVDASGLEALAESAAVWLGGDDDHRLAGVEPSGEKISDGLVKELLAIVELDGVVFARSDALRGRRRGSHGGKVASGVRLVDAK